MSGTIEEKKRLAAECWRKGSEAMSKENWDYAIDMFSKAVLFVPENLLYRQTLRGVEYRKYNNNKTGARMAGMRLMTLKGRIKKAKMQKDWQTVERLAEEGLQLNPWDAQLNADLAEACKNLGYQEVAAFAYQCALKEDPDNKAYNEAYARLLEERGEYQQAMKIWAHLMKLDPHNSEARMKYNELQAAHVLNRGGYQEAKDARGVTVEQAVAKKVGMDKSGPVDGPGVSVEADLKRAIRKEPNNPDNYVKLAQHYRDERKLDEAIELLQKAVELAKDDPGVKELLEDVELERLRKQVEDAKDKAAETGNEEDQKKAAELARELLRREIQVFAERVERYPANLRLKYELAQRYMRVKQIAKAIPLLQQCVKDTRIAGEVLVCLGECFLADKKPQLARRQFEKSLQYLNAQDHPNLFKRAHYSLGRICEQAGEKAAAEDHYSEVLAIDYEYRDALQRLEALQAEDGGQSAEEGSEG